MILSVTKMMLIYLNYRIWFVQLKVIYGNVLNTLVFDRDGKYTDEYKMSDCVSLYFLE